MEDERCLVVLWVREFLGRRSFFGFLVKRLNWGFLVLIGYEESLVFVGG